MALTEIIPATVDQEPILAQLLELYAHDFSEFLHLELSEDGRFGYPQLPLYWLEPDRHPFLVRIEGRLAGCVLVMKRPGVFGRAGVWDMAEFFLVRGYRRQGAGTEIARQVWTRFPGPWEIRVMDVNRAGVQFWERAVRAFTGEDIQPASLEKNGQSWRVFSFASMPALS